MQPGRGGGGVSAALYLELDQAPGKDRALWRDCLGSPPPQNSDCFLEILGQLLNHSELQQVMSEKKPRMAVLSRRGVKPRTGWRSFPIGVVRVAQGRSSAAARVAPGTRSHSTDI